MPANIKDLNKRIRSIRNTQQITKAMKMVAAAKLRRTQERMLASRPYGDKLQELLAQLGSTASIDHPFLQPREIQKRLVLVVASDKGLCGSYNSNVLRHAERRLEQLTEPTELYVVGRKANDYFRRRRWPIVESVVDLGGMIDLPRMNDIADDLMRRYLEDEVQEILVVYTEFITTLSNRPAEFQLLPFPSNQDGEGEAKRSAREYIYEPDAETVLRQLLPNSVRIAVFNALAEAFTSEHGSRMTSMGAATDNAGDLIENLVLFRNRARQAAITQEISEIVGGADALV